MPPSSAWSLNYTFAPNGNGGVLHSPDAATVTLVGGVIGVTFGNNGSGGDLIITYVPPAYGPGTYLLGFPVPIAPASFSQVTGRSPTTGDSVETLDGATQIATTTTFNGTTWDNGTPTFAIGEAAYITLSTPEPSTWALFVLGSAALIFFRCFRPQKSRS